MYTQGEIYLNPKSSNLWIVEDATIGAIVQLWSDRLKLIPKTPKRDVIKQPTVLLPISLPDAMKRMNVTTVPAWVYTLRGVTPPPTLPLPALNNMVAPAVVQKVQKALGINLTPEVRPATLAKSDLCPARKDGDHVFKSYTGLNQSFDYCVHCDRKSYPIKT